MPSSPAGGPAVRAGALAQVLHHQQRGEQVADLVGEVGMAIEILLKGGPLAAALPLEEVLGQEFHRVPLAAGGLHGSAPVRKDARPAPTRRHTGRQRRTRSAAAAGSDVDGAACLYIREPPADVHGRGGFFPGARRSRATPGPPRSRYSGDGRDRSGEVAQDLSGRTVATSLDQHTRCPPRRGPPGPGPSLMYMI